MHKRWIIISLAVVILLPVMLLIIGVMTLIAGYTSGGRATGVPHARPVALLSISLGAALTLGLLVGLNVFSFTAQQIIPIAGMVIGNSMNAMAISLERLLGDLRGRRGEVEMQLCLGADYREASQDIFRDAMRAGMIPSINSMMAVGVVFIPGMMTGQILAGADPVSAIRYQIVVMVMLVGSTALGSLLVLSLVRRRCFGPAQQLLLKQFQNRL